MEGSLVDTRGVAGGCPFRRRGSLGSGTRVAPPVKKVLKKVLLKKVLKKVPPDF
jgi:hypothetical protein